MITRFEKFLLNEHVGPEHAGSFKYGISLPTDNDIFNDAVSNTEGCTITKDGLLIDAVRYQHENQDGMTSLRTGVFYLPKGDKNQRYYKGNKSGYGGSSYHEGTILIRKPLFVKGATGGKAPENAYDSIVGKGSYQNMRTEVLRKATRNFRKRILPEDVAEILTEYNEGTDYDDNYNIAYVIIDNSIVGNTLAYAIQENIVAHAVREAGYDSVLGYSKRRDGTYFISEIFDVRELSYPSSYNDPNIHPKYI